MKLTVRVWIFSGVSLATVSMSTPPSLEVMKVTAWLLRSTSTDRYSSLAMSVPSEISTVSIGRAMPPDW